MNAAARSNLIGPEIVISLAEIAGIDPCNSRDAEPAEIEAMAASLREHRQMSPLLVRKPRRGSGCLVLAGGRRWRAFQLLAASAGDAARVEIRARVFNGDDEAAREASLAENFEREGLHPLDEAERFAHLAKASSVDAVADRYGAPRRYLRERLALAALSAKVKAAWRAGAIGLEAAKAFAAAREPAEQDALLAAPDFSLFAGHPLEIRRRLPSRAVAASAPAALFVGAEAYCAAGGTIVEELFGAEALFADRALLERLERDKLERIARDLRAEEGWGFVVAADDMAPRQMLSDLKPEETRELAAIERAQNETLTPEAYEALLAERDRLERVGALRAVPLAERHAYGVAVSVDAEGRLTVERAILRRIVEHADPLAAAGDQVPPASPGEGEPGASPLPVPQLGGPGRGAAAGVAAPRRVPLDAPLAPGARRVGEAAASRAVADAVAADPTLAVAACLCAFAVAGAHRRPVGVRRDQGPRSVKSELALKLGKTPFGEALSLCAGFFSDGVASAVDLRAAFAECVAAAIDMRGADADYNSALIDAARAVEPEIAQRIAETLDYSAFFREASRATALSAIRDCGGEALELSHAWRDDEALAREAAILARARSWLPAFLAPGEKSS